MALPYTRPSLKITPRSYSLTIRTALAMINMMNDEQQHRERDDQETETSRLQQPQAHLQAPLDRVPNGRGSSNSAIRMSAAHGTATCPDCTIGTMHSERALKRGGPNGPPLELFSPPAAIRAL